MYDFPLDVMTDSELQDVKSLGYCDYFHAVRSV